MATVYRVLQRLADLAAGQRDAFVQVASLEAQSGAQAIRRFVEQQAEKTSEALTAGVFAAVPERSWTEQAVEVEARPRIVLREPPTRPQLVEHEHSPPPRREAASASGSG